MLDAVTFNEAHTMVDLTDPLSVKYGTDPTATLAGLHMLWPGNVLPDGTVKYTGQNNDRDLILTAIGGITPTNIVNGYYPTDVNLDGQVKYTGTQNDRDIILQTIGGLVATQVRVEQMP